MRGKTALFGSLKKHCCIETRAKGCLKWLVRLAQPGVRLKRGWPVFRIVTEPLKILLECQ
jgi:hypothetical protein